MYLLSDSHLVSLYTHMHVHTHMQTEESQHYLIFSGSATVTAYQQALSTVGYINTASEPTPAPRFIHYRVFDGTFISNTATANLTLSLTNDHILMLLCGVGTVTYLEGSPQSVPVASELTLVDLDEDHMIIGASAEIRVPLEGDELALDPSVTPLLEVSQTTNTSIQITGAASDDYYQVQ